MFSAVGRAVNLAMEISKFPQQCMLADRASAYHGAFDSTNTEQALRTEWNRGRKVIETEAIHGSLTTGICCMWENNLLQQKKTLPNHRPWIMQTDMTAENDLFYSRIGKCYTQVQYITT